MSWTDPATWANERLSASKFNTEVVDNMSETLPAKAKTAGDLFVADGANHLSRLPIGDDQAVLTVDDTAALGMAWKRYSQNEYSIFCPTHYAYSPGTLYWPEDITGTWAAPDIATTTDLVRFLMNVVVPPNFDALTGLDVCLVQITSDVGTLDWSCNVSWMVAGSTFSNPPPNQLITGSLEVPSGSTSSWRIDISSGLDGVELVPGMVLGIRFVAEGTRDMAQVGCGGVDFRYTAAAA